VARRKIREYDGKKLISENLGLDFKSVLVTSETDLGKLAEEHPWLKETKLVVKPDQLFGKRGKSNLVLLDVDFESAKKFIKERMNNEAEVKNIKGTLTHFLVEPFVPHKEEYYVSISTGREADIINFSTQGGIDVEENWNKVIQISVPVGSSIDDVIEEKIPKEIPEERRKKIIDFVKSLYKFFVDFDFAVLESNPFVFDDKENIVMLDLVAEVDDTASFKNIKKWDGLDFPTGFGRKLHEEEEYIKELDSKSGSSLKLTLLNPKGRLWTMVAGGGASVIYTDTVIDLGFGEELANYGEYSGNPKEEETYLYAKTILDLMTRESGDGGKVLLIGGGIANFTDVANTFKGIIKALKEYKEKLQKANVNIFVRRGGPNYKEGLRLMRSLGEEIGVPIQVYGPETHMTKIVPLAIEKLRG